MKSTVLSLALVLTSLPAMAGASPVSQLALQQASANNAFALDLFKQVAAADGNLFVSPFSVTSALAIPYAGASGETAEQMATALGYGNPAGVGRAFHELDQRLTASDATNGFTLNVANRLWTQTGMELSPSFLQLVGDNYGPAVAPLDFQANPEAARSTVNQWVEAQTNDKIKNLIPEGALDPLTRMVVTNAVYFKAQWANPFDEEFTQDGAFHLASGDVVSAPMMHGSFELNYAHAEDLGLTAVELPYRFAYDAPEPRSVSLIALVPEQVGKLGAVRSALTSERLEALIKGLGSAQVTLSFPKFRVESSLDASQALKSLGVEDLFDPARADLSALLAQPASEQLFVSQVLHKTFINLNESGTEAAGATAVIIGTTSVIYPQVSLDVDRPFLYLIRDQATGSILFMGQVADPRA